MPLRQAQDRPQPAHSRVLWKSALRMCFINKLGKFPAFSTNGLAGVLGSARAEQAGEESGFLHRQDRAVLHVAQARVAVGAREGPAVGSAAAVALGRHGARPHFEPVRRVQ